MRVHQQQHVAALVAEALGDAGGDERRPRSRTSGGSSEVATTTTVRAMPSGPRSSSRNSRTSRPRSPISPMTRIVGVGAAGDHATAGWTCRRRSRRRCPGAGPGRTGTRVSSARTPKRQRLVDPACGRGRAGVSLARSTYETPRAQRRAAVHRAAEAVEDPAEQRLADRHLQRHAGGAHAGAGVTPERSPSGMQVSRSRADGDDLGEQRRSAGRRSRRRSPTAAVEPVDGDGQAHGAADRAGHARPGGRAGARSMRSLERRVTAREHRPGPARGPARAGRRSGGAPVSATAPARSTAPGRRRRVHRAAGARRAPRPAISREVVGVQPDDDRRVGRHSASARRTASRPGGRRASSRPSRSSTSVRTVADDRLADVVGDRHGASLEPARRRRRARRWPRRPGAPSGPARRPAARRPRLGLGDDARRPRMPSAWPAAKPSARACSRSRSSSSA